MVCNFFEVTGTVLTAAGAFGAGAVVDAGLSEVPELHPTIETIKTVEAQSKPFITQPPNPNTVTKVDGRTPEDIIKNIEAQGRIVADALARLGALLSPKESA